MRLTLFYVLFRRLMARLFLEAHGRLADETQHPKGRHFFMLDERESIVLNCFEHTLLKQGRAPTLAEVADALGVKARSAAHKYVHRLVEKGYLIQERKGWRGITLNRELETPQIPILGKIAAGQPIEVMEDETSLNLADYFIGQGHYGLKVTGDSMIDAGILDGDTVIIKQQQTARKGQIVAVLVDQHEVTLKTLGKKEQDQVELIPENNTMETMTYHVDRVEIQGVLIGQLRRYNSL